MRVFISHSSSDRAVAAALIDLLRLALNLAAEEIRCTSVDGYKLQGGATVDDQLKHEVHDAELFIGLVTPSSTKSAYVMFELGARWGASKLLIPVLAAGAKSKDLKRPLAALNSLDCSNEADIHALVAQAAEELAAPVGSAAAYQKPLKILVREAGAVRDRDHAANGQVPPKDTDVVPSEPLLEEEIEVLGVLASDEVDGRGEIRVTKLADRLQRPRGAVGLVIKKLRANGLVELNPDDPRFVGATEKGAERYLNASQK